MSQSPPQSMMNHTSPPPRPQTSGVAVASLVFGLLGLLTFGLAGVAGLVLGVIGIRQINRSEGALTGKPLAVGGLIASALSIVIAGLLVLLAVMLYPQLVAARSVAKAIQTQSTMRQESLGIMLYANQNNNRLPDATQWRQQASASLGRPMPPASASGPSLAMNKHLSQVNVNTIANPTQTVLLFEVPPGGPSFGDDNDLPAQPAYPPDYLIGFVDGHVEMVPPQDLPYLIWQP